MSGKEFATRVFRCHYSPENNAIFDETVGCSVIFERWVPRRKRAFTIDLFSFWEIRGISELGSSLLPATENSS